MESAAFAAVPVRDVNGATEGLEQRVERLERMLESRNQVQLEMQQQLSGLESEVGQLRGALELHSHQLEQILNRQRDIYQDIDRRLGQASVQPSITVTPPGDTTSPSDNNSDVAANLAYEKAFDLLKNKRYDDATTAFNQFVEKYPTSSYVANAYYWQGQLSFRTSDWVNAQTAFSAVVESFPASTKRAESIFKLGLIAEKQGKTAEAKKRFQQVVTDYPSSSVAQMAKSKL